MFWLVIFGVLFLYSANGLEYYDEDGEPGFKPETGTPMDVDYISGIFGDRHDPDGNFVSFAISFFESECAKTISSKLYFKLYITPIHDT